MSLSAYNRGLSTVSTRSTRQYSELPALASPERHCLPSEPLLTPVLDHCLRYCQVLDHCLPYSTVSASINLFPAGSEKTTENRSFRLRKDRAATARRLRRTWSHRANPCPSPNQSARPRALRRCPTSRPRPNQSRSHSPRPQLPRGRARSYRVTRPASAAPRQGGAAPHHPRARRYRHESATSRHTSRHQPTSPLFLGH